MSAHHRGQLHAVARGRALLEDATRILMLNHDVDEGYALEMLCDQAARSETTIVETAARVIAEAVSDAQASRDHLRAIGETGPFERDEATLTAE